MNVSEALRPLVHNVSLSWQVVKFRRVASLREDRRGPYGLPPLSLSSAAGDLSPRDHSSRQQPSDDYLERYWLVSPDNLVVNPMWLIGGSIGVSRVAGSVSPDYRVYQLADKLAPRYMHYLMRSKPYRDQYNLLVRAETTFDRRITKQDFHDLPVLLPPLATQHTIVRFLDVQTAHIGALISKKHCMSNLLTKRRSASISHALWHASPYERVRLRHLSGRPTSGNRDHTSFVFTESGVPCLRGLNIKPARIDRRDLLQIDDSAHLIHANTALAAGDLVIVRSGFAGSAALVPPDMDGCNCVDLVIVRKSSALIPRYLEYVVNSQEAQEQVRQQSSGALLSHFNAVDAGDLVVPLRELPQQARIVDELDEACSNTDQLIGTIERQIELLQEHRQALITAAVTGEMDVPGVRR